MSFELFFHKSKHSRRQRKYHLNLLSQFYKLLQCFSISSKLSRSILRIIIKIRLGTVVNDRLTLSLTSVRYSFSLFKRLRAQIPRTMPCIKIIGVTDPPQSRKLQINLINCLHSALFVTASPIFLISLNYVSFDSQ